MRKIVTMLLTLAMMLSLCCFGVAYAEGPKTGPGKERSRAAAMEPASEPDETALEEADIGDAIIKDATIEGETIEDVFADWNKDAPALNALIAYMEAVTDASSDDFIPVEDRIAVFDMDGTLYGELFPTYLEYYMLAWRILKDPSITPDAEMLALGRELRESVINHQFASDMPNRRPGPMPG